jgi:hypothetical protein
MDVFPLHANGVVAVSEPEFSKPSERHHTGKKDP